MKKILIIIVIASLAASCAPARHVPGNSIADRRLMRDAEMQGIFITITSKMQKECPEKLAHANSRDVALLNTEITTPLTRVADGSVWEEVWTYKYCGDKTARFHINFFNQGMSGTTFQVKEVQ